jgi:hypothetical protein
MSWTLTSNWRRPISLFRLCLDGVNAQFIGRHRMLSFFHYDFYSQALAKIERAHPRDRHDVGHMLESGLVVPERLNELFAAVEAQLIRYPAVEPDILGKRVAAIAAGDPW